jgi:hypothetical protein
MTKNILRQNQTYCAPGRVTVDRLKQAVQHKTCPSGEEVILDHAYRGQSSTNPCGTKKFMSIGDQQFLARRDRDMYEDLMRQQSKAGRKSALSLIRQLKTVDLRRAFNTWYNTVQWSRAIRSTFKRFDRDGYACAGVSLDSVCES